MTTTPEERRPDEAPEPDEARSAEQAAASRAGAPDEAQTPAAGDTQPIAGTPGAGDTQPIAGTPGAGDTQPIAGTPAAGDTQPLPMDDTARLSPATPEGAAPAAASEVPAAPADGAPATPVAPAAPAYPAAGYQPPYAGQPYAGPAAPAPQPGYPPAAPYGYARPIGGSQQYGAPYAAPQQPYARQQPYTGQPYAGQQSYAGQQPYAGQQQYAAPGGPGAQASGPQAAGTQPAGAPGPVAPAAAGARGPRTRRPWLPVVATLVVVVLLAAAAVLVATHPWRGSATASQGGPQSASIATIGQGSSGAVPVAGSTVANPNWPAVAAAVQGSVVAIDVKTSTGEALGSGVIVDDKGHVVTNNHVVDGLQGKTVQVTLSDGRLYDATIAGTDPSTDLAVVTLKNPPSDLTVAQFGNSSDVKVGDPVMAVGNPLGLANTVTTGIVSAVNRPVSPQSTSGTQGPVTNAIQIDAAINPGNSGGPLFNAKGQVIGITSSIATTSGSSGSIGLGFAIPVQLVKNIAGQIIAHGSAQHAYLGVTLQDGQATADGVTRRGAQVMSVESGSPASAAGLKVGDVVVAIDGQPVGSSDSLAAYVRAMSSGEKATLVLVRNGKSLSVTATLATKADTSSQNPQGAPSTQNGNSGSSGTMPGNLQNMTPQELWQWLQQQQGQGSGTPGSGTPGSSSQG